MANLLSIVNLEASSAPWSFPSVGRGPDGTIWRTAHAGEYGATCAICTGSIGNGDGYWSANDGRAAHDECVTIDARPDALFQYVGSARDEPLPYSSWPGCYTLVYYTRSMDALCATCADLPGYRSDPETCPVAADTTDNNWEEDLLCSDCGTLLAERNLD